MLCAFEKPKLMETRFSRRYVLIHNTSMRCPFYTGCLSTISRVSGCLFMHMATQKPAHVQRHHAHMGRGSSGQGTCLLLNPRSHALYQLPFCFCERLWPPNQAPLRFDNLTLGKYEKSNMDTKTMNDTKMLHQRSNEESRARASTPDALHSSH